mgnify:CR=1 FL=1
MGKASNEEIRTSSPKANHFSKLWCLRFTLMQTSDTQAFEHAAEKFGYEKETLKPTVVDLWGSCNFQNQP